MNAGLAAAYIVAGFAAATCGFLFGAWGMGAL